MSLPRLALKVAPVFPSQFPSGKLLKWSYPIPISEKKGSLQFAEMDPERTVSRQTHIVRINVMSIFPVKFAKTRLPYDKLENKSKKKDDVSYLIPIRASFQDEIVFRVSIFCVTICTHSG